MKYLLQISLLLLVLISCDETFDPPPKALLQATFWNSANGQSTSPTISVHGIGMDTTWIDSISTNSIFLPLAKNETSDFVVSMDLIADTLQLSYQTDLIFESMESGFYYKYKLLSVKFSKNRIDSLIVIDSLITKNWNENFQLYIHPLSDSNN